MPVAAQLADGRLDLEHRLHREGSEADNHARPHQIDLAKKKGLAGCDLVALGITIFRRAAFDDVADVNFGPRQAHPALDDIGEQLSRASDERLAAQILVVARRLADKHQIGLGVADAEDDVGAQRGELAAGAFADEVAQGGEVAGLFESGIEIEKIRGRRLSGRISDAGRSGRRGDFLGYRGRLRFGRG